AERGLLATLETLVAGLPVQPEAMTERVRYWARKGELVTLLRANLRGNDGRFDDDYRIGHIDLSKLTRVSVRGPRIERPPQSPSPTDDDDLINQLVDGFGGGRPAFTPVPDSLE